MPALAHAATASPRSNIASVNQGKLIKIDDGPKTVALVQAEIWKHGADYTKIATAADVSYGTVARIAQGETTRPMLRTIIRILGALGWDIYAQEKQR
jgi:transcriptional regulator with XRE-family HTH domain